MTALQTTAPAAPPTTRFADIDALRNLGILYLFPFHTARVFDLGEPYYVEGQPQLWTTALIGASGWFMPLLFLLAGIASFHGLGRRSNGQYLKERVSRLLIPLLFGLVVLVPPQAYLGLVVHTGSAPAYPAFLAGYFLDWSDLSGYHGTFTPGQLWFIAFLFVLSLALLPVMRSLHRRQVRAEWLGRPIAGVVVPVLTLTLLSALPGLSGKNPFVYAGYILAGFLLAGAPAALAGITRRRRTYLVLALVGTAGMLTEAGTIGWQSGFTPVGAAFTLLHVLVCWLAILAILGYGRAHLDRPSRVMAYLTPAAFPVFVLHQTFVVLAAWLILPAVDGVVLEYALILLGSAAASFAAYELLRRIPLFRFLLGVKARSRRGAPAGRGSGQGETAAPTTTDSGVSR